MNDAGEPIDVSDPDRAPYAKPRITAPDADAAATARFKGEVRTWAERIDAARRTTKAKAE